MSPRAVDRDKEKRTEIARTTLETVQRGKFVLDDVMHDVSASTARSLEGVRLYGPESPLAEWRHGPARSSFTPASPVFRDTTCKSIILEISTLAGARLLWTTSKASDRSAIGILNFASAKTPGGGFLTGAQAQEESLARSSNLYATLQTDLAEQFYTLHRLDPEGGYYSHSILYSPSVTFFRDDDGTFLKPIEVDVMTCAAVNAGVVRQSFFARLAGKSEEAKIERVMRERMARILAVAERHGLRQLVLGSFGTGVFKNKVEMVAGIWADLLGKESSRFGKSFDRVVFAILGKETFTRFEDAFEARVIGDGRYRGESASMHSS